jgi:hypothetical protein
MENNWTKIFRTSNVHTAEIIKGMLIEEGIECLELNKKDSSYAFGEVELYCPLEEVLRAKTLIGNIEDDLTTV